MAHSGRLHRVTLELTLADALLVVLQRLREFLGLLEVDVRLERVRLTNSLNSVMRMHSVVRMQVETHVRVVSRSCFSHFSILSQILFLFINLKLGTIRLLNIN